MATTSQRAQARAPRDRVEEIDAQLFADTHKLGGDLTKAILTLIKQQPTVWQKQNETQQERTIQRCQDIAHEIVHQITAIIATAGFDAYPVAVGKIDVEKAISMKVSTPCTDEAMIAVFRGRGEQWMLVRADARHYFGGVRPTPDNIGDLGMPMPKGEKPEGSKPKVVEPVARTDEANLAQVGTGKPESPKAGKPESPSVEAGADAPPSNEQPRPTAEGEQQQPQPEGAAAPGASATTSADEEFYDTRAEQLEPEKKRRAADPGAAGTAFGDAKPGDKLN